MTTPTLTAKSQAMAVCCAAVVALRGTATTTRTRADPTPGSHFESAGSRQPRSRVGAECAPSMVVWAQSSLLVRAWAEDWVLRPEREAVFGLPISPSQGRDSVSSYLFVSVSPTLGVVDHCWLSCGPMEGVCGCIGAGRLLATARPKRFFHTTERDHVIGYAKSWNDGEEDPQGGGSNCNRQRWGKMSVLSSVTCNRKWIVATTPPEERNIRICKVVCGVPVEPNVFVPCNSAGVLNILLASWSDDVAILLAVLPVVGANDDEKKRDCAILVDLDASFNRKELIVISVIECCTHLPTPTRGITWTPEGSLRVMQFSYNDMSYSLVDPATGHTTWHFGVTEDVYPIGKTHLLVCKRQCEYFQVFHTGNLGTPSLCVPCHWARPSSRSGLILSTTAHVNRGADLPRIEFSLHDGATGFLIGMFATP